MAINRFGRWLARERERRQLSQRDLAIRIRSHPAQVSRWETGSRLPELPSFGALVFALELDANVALKHAYDAKVAKERTARRSGWRKRRRRRQRAATPEAA